MIWRRLSVDIDHEEAPTNGISMYIDVYVDDKIMDDILDIEVFFDAIEKNGRYPLFTCTCGCFGCGGYYVDIECTEDAWIMKNKYHPHDERILVEEFEYRFTWTQVCLVATQIKDHVMRICQEQSEPVPIISGASGNDLRNCLQHMNLVTQCRTDALTRQ